MVAVSVRKAIESLYTGLCDIINQQEVTDATTGQTSFTEAVAVKQQPCRLSYSVITAATEGDSTATVRQIIKLFIAPEIEVQPGARVAVTQNGRTTEYKAAGQPAVHSNHQEIILRLADDKA